MNLPFCLYLAHIWLLRALKYLRVFGREAFSGRFAEHASGLADESRQRWLRGGDFAVLLANETGSGPKSGSFVPLLSNSAPIEELDDDGAAWVQLAPFGKFKHRSKKYGELMQAFDRKDAVNLVNEFGSFKNIVARTLGLPWYEGHPDSPQFSWRDKDTRSKGRIRKMEVRDDGLYGLVKFNKWGRELVNEKTYHGHSPNWFSLKDKFGLYRPVKLKSMGFTNNPNLPVKPVLTANEDGDLEADDSDAIIFEDTEPLPNEAEHPDNPTNEENPMNPILQILLANGLIEPTAGNTEPDETALAEAVRALCNERNELQQTVDGAGDLFTLAPLANEALDGVAVALRKIVFDANQNRDEGVDEISLATIANEAGLSEGMVSALERRASHPADPAALNQVGGALNLSGAAPLLANAAIIDLEAQLANEREARAGMVVDQAITDGRILQGARDERIAELANSEDFDAAAEAIGQLPQAVPSGSRTDAVGSRKPGSQSGTAQARELANEAVKKGEFASFDAAWNHQRKTRPELFEATASSDDDND